MSVFQFSLPGVGIFSLLCSELFARLSLLSGVLLWVCFAAQFADYLLCTESLQVRGQVWRGLEALSHAGSLSHRPVSLLKQSPRAKRCCYCFRFNCRAPSSCNRKTLGLIRTFWRRARSANRRIDDCASRSCSVRLRFASIAIAWLARRFLVTPFKFVIRQLLCASR